MGDKSPIFPDSCSFSQHISSATFQNWDKVIIVLITTFQFYLMKATISHPSIDIVSGFHALSDPIRLRVLELLRSQELCVCELCEQLGTTQSKLSFHLKTLKEAGLVRSRQEGRWIYYSLNLAQFIALEEYIADYRRFSLISPARHCSEPS